MADAGRAEYNRQAVHSAERLSTDDAFVAPAGLRPCTDSHPLCNMRCNRSAARVAPRTEGHSVTEH